MTICSCKKLSVESFMPLFMLYYDRVENGRVKKGEEKGG